MCQTFRFSVYSARKSCMKYRFEYLPYRRKFRRPLVTAHGAWEFREGIVIRLEEPGGAYAFGEIAPVPWFGTESFDLALAWCHEVEARIDPEDRAPTPLPCCNWALFSALKGIQETAVDRSIPVAALVVNADALPVKQAAGFSRYKLKIATKDRLAEMASMDALMTLLKEGDALRLDANGGLDERDYKAWLEFLEGKPVEFLEQPLGPGLENRMLEIAEPFSTPIALDESISGFTSLCTWQHWPGPLVVKPSLLGWVDGELPPTVLGSSAFETAFGFEANMQFLSRHQKLDTAVGFDTNHLLEDDGWSLHGSCSSFTPGEITNADLQTLWKEKCEAIS
ncbi:MAG: o-succinylbenzoate synthase [Cyanothece sp. SIO1E1]|nr:o-succinylbenzoate synthase [Cyanothece sp. SIO1E1]